MATMKNAFRPVRRAARRICPKTWCVTGVDLRNGGQCPDCRGTGLQH